VSAGLSRRPWLASQTGDATAVSSLPTATACPMAPLSQVVNLPAQSGSPWVGVIAGLVLTDAKLRHEGPADEGRFSPSRKPRGEGDCGTGTPLSGRIVILQSQERPQTGRGQTTGSTRQPH
jgi:hypothetical protein